MTAELRIDFREPLPIFTLGSVALLPHAILRVHVFEDRYRQMVRRCLAAAGSGGVLDALPIALATTGGVPAHLREGVCVAKIVQVQALPDGRFNLVVHGVAGARITHLELPDGDRLYHQARCAPIVRSRPGLAKGVRRELGAALADPVLRRYSVMGRVCDVLSAAEVPPQAAIDLAGDAIVHRNDERYDLLVAEDCRRQGEIIWRQAQRMKEMALGTASQSHGRWPRGCSWN